MARLTKLRGAQTRASETFSPGTDNLATDTEVEERVQKHSWLFHGRRDENIKLIFDANGQLQGMEKLGLANELLSNVSFSFQLDGTLSTMVNEKFNLDGTTYIKQQKDFIFVGGNLDEIQSRIL